MVGRVRGVRPAGWAGRAAVVSVRECLGVGQLRLPLEARIHRPGAAQSEKGREKETVSEPEPSKNQGQG